MRDEGKLSRAFLLAIPEYFSTVAGLFIFNTSWEQVQAADSLLKLVSELKQTAIFSSFASLNDHVDRRIVEFNQLSEKTDAMLARIGEEASASLKDLECHYYSSAQRINQNLQPWAKGSALEQFYLLLNPPPSSSSLSLSLVN